jgi:hypothetical protein
LKSQIKIYKEKTEEILKLEKLDEKKIYNSCKNKSLKIIPNKNNINNTNNTKPALSTTTTENYIRSNKKKLTDKTTTIAIGNSTKRLLKIKSDNGSNPVLECNVNSINNTQIKYDYEDDAEEIYENFNKIRDIVLNYVSRKKIYNIKNLKQCANFNNYSSTTILSQNHNKNNNKNNNNISKENLQRGFEGIIELVPRLIPEEFVRICKGCERTFGLCRWKYHCRVCGFIFCFYCSNNFDNFIPFYLGIIRICDGCYKGKKNKIYLI